MSNQRVHPLANEAHAMCKEARLYIANAHLYSEADAASNAGPSPPERDRVVISKP